MTPLLPLKYRLYACSECGHQVELQTNHRGPCYPTCQGKCRQILNPHTAREVVLPKQTEHHFVMEVS